MSYENLVLGQSKDQEQESAHQRRGRAFHKIEHVDGGPSQPRDAKGPDGTRGFARGRGKGRQHATSSLAVNGTLGDAV